MKKSIINLDSDASPYIEQKDVILCRSGIQYYHKSELQAFITDSNKPPVEKEWYREYRPANVVIKAKELFKSLPITKEHPDCWVTPRTWKELAGGATDRHVEVVALDGESDGEIGLKTSVTFYDADLYDYYSNNNKEVSVGYTCKKHFIDNPEEVGYDIILDEIEEVNHLAITKSGRGGSSVAVIDSLLGGMKPMRTGMFAWLTSRKQKDSADDVSFGTKVFDSLKVSKGTTEAELAEEMKSVLDSCTILKDCEAKETLINAVKDCFDHKDFALADEQAITEQFDGLYKTALDESTKDFDAMDSEKEEKTEEKAEDSTEEVEDSKDETEEKAEDSDKEVEEKAEDSEETEEKEEDGCNKDSMSTLDKEAVSAIVNDTLNNSLKALVMDAVKECLGIKEGNTASEARGCVVDSIKEKTEMVSYDYSSFLEG